MVKLTFEDLALATSEDNRSAFNMLYQVYYNKIFRFAYYFLRDKEACRDVVLDVFLSIWQSRKKLKDITNLEAYFYIITKNEAARYLNKQQEYNQIVLNDLSIQLKDQVETPPDLSIQLKDQVETPPDQKLIEKEIEQLLTEIINELPEKCRIIFLMARQEGLKPKEIGEILSLSESTIRVQMKIAIEKIVAKIRPHFPDLTLTALLTLLIEIYQDIY